MNENRDLLHSIFISLSHSLQKALAYLLQENPIWLFSFQVDLYLLSKIFLKFNSYTIYGEFNSNEIFVYEIYDEISIIFVTSKCPFFWALRFGKTQFPNLEVKDSGLT